MRIVGRQPKNPLTALATGLDLQIVVVVVVVVVVEDLVSRSFFGQMYPPKSLETIESLTRRYYAVLVPCSLSMV